MIGYQDMFEVNNAIDRTLEAVESFWSDRYVDLEGVKRYALEAAVQFWQDMTRQISEGSDIAPEIFMAAWFAGTFELGWRMCEEAQGNPQ